MSSPAPIKDEPGEQTEAAVKRLREDEQESSSKRQAVAKGDSDDDDDIIVCSPPKQAQSAIPLESDNPEVTWTNVTNPLVDFPHARKDCGVHQFDKSSHELCCPKCCCIVCERSSSLIEPMSAILSCCRNAVRASSRRLGDMILLRLEQSAG